MPAPIAKVILLKYSAAVFMFKYTFVQTTRNRVSCAYLVCNNVCTLLAMASEDACRALGHKARAISSLELAAL